MRKKQNKANNKDTKQHVLVQSSRSNNFPLTVPRKRPSVSYGAEDVPLSLTFPPATQQEWSLSVQKKNEGSLVYRDGIGMDKAGTDKIKSPSPATRNSSRRANGVRLGAWVTIFRRAERAIEMNRKGGLGPDWRVESGIAKVFVVEGYCPHGSLNGRNFRSPFFSHLEHY